MSCLHPQMAKPSDPNEERSLSPTHRTACTWTQMSSSQDNRLRVRKRVTTSNGSQNDTQSKHTVTNASNEHACSRARKPSEKPGSAASFIGEMSRIHVSLRWRTNRSEDSAALLCPDACAYGRSAHVAKSPAWHARSCAWAFGSRFFFFSFFLPFISFAFLLVVCLNRL
jgi:hypothetical protein